MFAAGCRELQAGSLRSPDEMVRAAIMSPMTDTADVSAIDGIINAAYAVFSGPVEQQRGWERERSLFWPGAGLIPTAMQAGDNMRALAPQFLDNEAYIARVEPFFREHGFYEKE